MEEKVILYTTHCPLCRGLEALLKKKNIDFEEEFIDADDPDSVKVMLDLGLKGAPGLVVNNQVMDYRTALNWVRGK